MLGIERVLLAFEARIEAEKYASLLETQDFPTDKVHRFDGDVLSKFLSASR